MLFAHLLGARDPDHSLLTLLPSSSVMHRFLGSRNLALQCIVLPAVCHESSIYEYQMTLVATLQDLGGLISSHEYIINCYI